MKKIITFLVMTVCLIAVDANAQSPKIMLKHGNTATLFDYDKLADAISASVDGDSIILSEGTFNGGVTINKKISIIGAGQKSIISGSVSFSMSGEQLLTSRLLDGLQITGNVSINSHVNGLTMRKVYMSALQTTTVKNAFIDRCYFSSYLEGSASMSGTVANSYINGIYRTAINMNFANCYIEMLNRNGNWDCEFGGKAYNCIIRTISSSYPNVSESCTLTNCLLGSGIKTDKAVVENCYVLTGSEISAIDRSNTSYLISNGYVGTDGTAVGEYGGQTPYTLTPKGPKITNMELKVDAQNNQLKVTATGTPN